jgi:hypothetical protein
MKKLNEMILDAYRDIVYKDEVSEAPLSDKHGMVMSLLGDASGFIKKANSLLKKKDTHWPDVVQNTKKAVSALQKAQSEAGK